MAKYRERAGKALGKRYPAKEVAEKVAQAFPRPARLNGAKGQQRGWAESMYTESEAVLSTMIALMHGRIPAWQSMTALSSHCRNGAKQQ